MKGLSTQSILACMALGLLVFMFTCLLASPDIMYIGPTPERARWTTIVLYLIIVIALTYFSYMVGRITMSHKRQEQFTQFLKDVDTKIKEFEVENKKIE